MKVRLTTTRWDQRTPKGITRRLRGEQFTVKDDIAEWLIRSGAAEQVGRAASTPSQPTTAAEEPVTEADVIAELDDEDGDGEDDEVAELDDDPADVEESTGRPAQSAPKSDWVAYAVSRGIPAKEAEGMDKQRLISRTA